MVPALVLLSDFDTDAPILPGVATVSKDGPDHGGYNLGVTAAMADRLWVDRPYFTGNPSDDWILDECRGTTTHGGYCQFGNELDLGYEGWVGGPTAYLAQWERLQEKYPWGNWVSQPPSGNADLYLWTNYNAKRHAVHAYGSAAQMQATVQWFLDRTSADLYITECNFGAQAKGDGPTIDVNAWALEQLKPFLEWCNQQPRVKMVAYFAWRWDRSDTLQTSVDAKGTIVPDVLGSPLGGNGGQTMNPYIEWIKAGGNGSVEAYTAHRANFGDSATKAMRDIFEALFPN